MLARNDDVAHSLEHLSLVLVLYYLGREHVVVEVFRSIAVNQLECILHEEGARLVDTHEEANEGTPVGHTDPHYLLNDALC